MSQDVKGRASGEGCEKHHRVPTTCPECEIDALRAELATARRPCQQTCLKLKNEVRHLKAVLAEIADSAGTGGELQALARKALGLK